MVAPSSASCSLVDRTAPGTRLLQRVAEVVQQFLAGLPLGVDAGHLLHLADPPFPVLLNDGGVLRSHRFLRFSTNKSLHGVYQAWAAFAWTAANQRIS
jgi:hypothetical protein